ncbi:MAG: glycosyltransferase family 2 protein [Acidobacteriota bacterium]
MSSTPNISIVIPNWNGRALLAEFLPSVLTAARYYCKEQNVETEVIVVDDASTDDSVEWLAENYPNEVRVVVRAHNGGFACAVNSGIATARYPLVFLLNNDIAVEADAIAPLVTHFYDTRVFAVCCKAYRLGSDMFDGAGKLGLFQKGHWRVFISYDVLPTRLSPEPEPFYSFVASGGYALFDRAKLIELGGFCELLAPFYWEDVDLCYRAWKRGWTIHYEPDSVVYHKSSATIGKKFKPHHVQVISERNRLLLHWMNLHDPIWFATHIFWLAIKLIGAAFTFDRVLWPSLFAALIRLPAVWRIRRQERAASVVSDREIETIFARVAAAYWAVVIRNPQDYHQYVNLKCQLEREAESQEAKSLCQ